MIFRIQLFILQIQDFKRGFTVKGLGIIVNAEICHVFFLLFLVRIFYHGEDRKNNE